MDETIKYCLNHRERDERQEEMMKWDRRSGKVTVKVGGASKKKIGCKVEKRRESLIGNGRGMLAVLKLPDLTPASEMMLIASRAN